MTNSFVEAINNEVNTTLTENGATTNISTLNKNLDWFFHGAALRNSNENRIWDFFYNAFLENKTDALRILFYIRDIRGGQGERRIFRTVLKNIMNSDDNSLIQWVKNNLSLIPEYGRWDDVVQLVNYKVISKEVCDFLKSQLDSDITNMNNNATVSLLAKWMPSEQSGTIQKQLSHKIMKMWNMKAKEYRHILSSLRKYINVLEKNLTIRDYNNIEYDKVPSNAMLKYRKAFYRNDKSRFEKYIEDVKNNSAKINSKTLYPYDILFKYCNRKTSENEKKTLEQLWKSLPDYVPNINGIAVCDTSGSMGYFDSTALSPIHVAMSLSLYIAERNKSEIWKNIVIPFSSQARYIRITGNTLEQKIHQIYTGDCSNTNLQAVCDLILKTAIDNNVPNEDMPQVLLILSDMEFDSCGSRTNFKEIAEKFKEANYTVPKIVWWNIDSRNNQTPATMNDNEVILLSGCSASVLPIALSGEYNPVEAMHRVINQKRYENIIFDK